MGRRRSPAPQFHAGGERGVVEALGGGAGAGEAGGADLVVAGGVADGGEAAFRGSAVEGLPAVIDRGAGAVGWVVAAVDSVAVAPDVQERVASSLEAVVFHRLGDLAEERAVEAHAEGVPLRPPEGRDSRGKGEPC